jgi:hypothetical protein
MQHIVLPKRGEAPMRKLRIFTALTGIVLATFGLALGQSQQREKVSEGRYQKYRDGKLTTEGVQSWTLWRSSDGGYELEDHFHLANPIGELTAAVGSQHLSPQLRQEMAGEVTQTEVDVKLSAELKIESLTVKGTRVVDGKAVDLETCFTAGHEIKCKGQSGGAKLNKNEPHEVFYSFPFPMLAVGLLQRAATQVGVSVPLTLAVMDLVPLNRPKVKLASCRGLVTLIGEEQIQLGERSYKVSKYVLEVDSKTEPLKLTVWLNKRLAVAMEEAGIPGERLQLVEYKNLSDF